MTNKIFKRASIAATAAALAFGAASANASLIVEGVTYTLLDNGSGSYTLNITGINGASDTRDGRYGVESFAFNKPAGYTGATPPSGFSLLAGGLDADGCNGNGNFFCFSAITDPTAPALAADSSLSFTFTVFGTMTGWNPDFKINWLGTENNYNLVSLILTPETSSTSSTSSSSSGDVPEPGPMSLTLLGLGLLGAGFMRRAKQSA